MATENRKNIYNLVSNKFDIGSFDEFNQKMDDSTSRKKLYDSVFNEFNDLGDFNTFEEKISLKKKVDSQPFSFDAPTGGIVSATGVVASKPGSQTSQATSGVGLPGAQPSPQTLQGNVDSYYQAQGKQSAISMYDNYQSSIKSIDDEISKNYPEDATGARTQSGLEDFNTYKAKRDELISKRDQFSAQSKASLNYINPIIESDINLEFNNNGLRKFTRFTDAGYEVADEYKIDDYAKEYAKQNGVSDDGTFKRLVYDKLKSSVSFNIIAPKIKEEFNVLFKNEFGLAPDKAIQKEYLANFVEGEKIKSNLLLQVQSLNKDIKTKLEDSSKLLTSEYKPQLEALSTDYKTQSALIDNKAKQLNESYKSGLIPKENYEMAFNNIQNELATLNSQYQQNFDSVSKQFLNTQNEVYSKYDKRYKRQVAEFTNMAEDQINEASSKYGEGFSMSDVLRKKYESTWTKATNKFLSEEEAVKYNVDRSFIPNNLGLQFVKNIFIGLGSGIKSISSMYDFDAGYVFGDYIENSITSSSPEIKSALDLLDLTKVQSSVGRMLGGMAPVLGASAAVAATTKNVPVAVQLLSTGLGNYILETAQIGGGIKDEVFRKTGNIADANKAAKKAVDANLYLLPLYALDGLPFLDDVTLGIKNLFLRAGAKAGIETLTELPQEYFQGIFEDLAIADKPISDTFKSMTLEKFTNTALNVVPTSILLGGGGTAFKGAKNEIVKIQGKSLAAKIDLFDLTQTAKKQFVYDTVLRRGDVFAKAYVSSLFSAGNINEQELESFSKMIEDSSKIMAETKKAGLNKADSKVYAALRFDYIQAKIEFDSEQDEVSKKLYKARMDSAEKSLTSYVSGGKPDAVVLTLANNEQYIYSFETLNSIIDEGGDLLNQIIDGDAKVGLLTDKNNPKAKALSDKLNQLKQDAVQKPSTSSQVSPVTERGQAIQEGSEGVGQEVEGTQAPQATNEEEVATLREQEQQELLETIPNIEEYKVDGEIDKGLMDDSTLEKYNEIYDKYDKLITPLLSEATAQNAPTKTTGVSATNKSQLNDLKSRVTDAVKSAVVQTAERAINTLKSILPGFDIIIHENEDSYNKATGNANTRGNFSYSVNPDGTYTGTIDINLSKANARTVAHEVAHAVLLKVFGENTKLFKDFRFKISKILTSSRNKELVTFANLYGTDVKAEEYLSELTGILEQQQDAISPTVLQQIAAYINEVVSKLTNGAIKPFENTKNTKDIIDFFNTVSGAIRKGEAINESDIKVKNVGEKVITKGKSKSQAEDIFTGKESTPKFKNLSDAAKWLNDWANKNKVFSENVSKVSDEEFVNKLVDHTVKELNAWESVKGNDYVGFYEEDIPNILNPGLQEFAEKRYGRLLTNEEIALYHMVSGFASPGADPIFDSSKGLEVFDKYMMSSENILSGYSDKQATIWEFNKLGKKVDTGKLKFDENGNPIYSQVAPKYAVQSLNKFKNVISYFGGLKKAINWALSTHSYEEISKVMGTPLSGPKRLGAHENLSKENGGFGIFGFTGPKLGSYILNRIGEYSTVTKDMWYARTMARLTGEPLVDSKGKALNEPWGQQTKDGLRKRLLADKAWDIVAKKLNITSSAVQQKMWDFEKRLYEKLGTIEKSGYASEGFFKGSKQIQEQERVNKSQKIEKALDSLDKKNTSKSTKFSFLDEESSIPENLLSGKPNSIVINRKTINDNEPYYMFFSKKIEKKNWWPNSYDIVQVINYSSAGKANAIMQYADNSNSPYSNYENGLFKISVSKTTTNRGIATKLLNRAEENGFDIVGNISKNSFTPDGKELLTKWLKNKLESTQKQVSKSQNIEKALEEQVANHKEYDGSTYSLTEGNLIGKPAASVSIFNERRLGIPTKNITTKMLSDFVDKNSDLYAGNEDVLALGTWWDSKVGETVIDVVAALPKKDAIQLGKDYNQKAVFDLENLEDIETGGTDEIIEGLKPEIERVEDIRKILGKSKSQKINWEISKEGKGDPTISVRSNIVQQAAQNLKEGKITNEEYRATASENSPIGPITKFFNPAALKQIINALSSDKVDKVNTPIKNGTEVGLRLDIPAYQNKNTWVVSVHEGATNAGKAISYTNVAKIIDVNFGVEPRGALGIASGKAKSTIGRMFGKWENIPGDTLEQKGENAKKLIQDIVNNPAWVQIGMNPFRHSYFYDRSSDIGRPVMKADEVIQVGGLVYAKNPVYGNWTDESFEVKGLLDSSGKVVRFQKIEGPKRVSGIKVSMIPKSAKEKANRVYQYDDMSDKEILETGRKLIESGAVNIVAVVDEIAMNDQPRALQPNEVAAAIWYKAALDTKYEELLTQRNKKFAKGEDVSALDTQISTVQTSIDLYNKMASITGRQQSLAFRLRKGLVDQDYNVQTRIEMYKKTNNGFIEPKLEQKFKDMAKELDAAKAEISRLEKEIASKEEEQAIQNITENTKAQSRKINKSALSATEQARKKQLANKFRTFNDITRIATLLADKEFLEYAKLILKEASGEFSQFAKEIVDTVGKDIKKYLPELYKKVGGKEKVDASTPTDKEIPKPSIDENGAIVIPSAFIKDLIKSGITSIQDITEAVKAELIEALPDITSREVRDAITKYGKELKQTKDEITLQINTAKRIGRLYSKLEDLKAGRTKAKTPKQLNDISREEANLRKQIKELGVGISLPKGKKTLTEEQRVENRIKYLEKYIAEKQRRITEGDFSPKAKPKPLPQTKKLIEAQARANRIREEYEVAQYANEQANRSGLRKTYDFIVELTSGLSKTLKAGLDLSAFFGQGIIYFASTNPRTSLKTFPEAFKGALNPEYEKRYLAELKSSPIYYVMEGSGLRLQTPLTTFENKDVEKASLGILTRLYNVLISPLKYVNPKVYDFAERFSPIAVTERAYTMTVNDMRIRMFIEFANELMQDGKTFETDPESFKIAANAVNNMTLSGRLRVLEPLAKELNLLFFSPRKVAAVLSLANPAYFVDVYRKDRVVGKKLLFKMATFISMASAAAIVSNAFSDDDEENPDIANPYSSDFMKIRIGSTRIDPFHGHLAPFILFARFITENYKSTSSFEKKKLGQDQFTPTRLGLITRYFSSKLSPFIVNAVKALDEKIGNEVEWEDEAVNALKPIWSEDISELKETHPAVMGNFLSFLSYIGLSGSTFGAPFFLDPNSKEDEKLYKLISYQNAAFNLKSKSNIKILDGQTLEDRGMTAEEYELYKKVYGAFIKSELLASYDEFRTMEHLTFEDRLKKIKSKANNVAKEQVSGLSENIEKITVKIGEEQVEYKLNKDELEYRRNLNETYISRRSGLYNKYFKEASKAGYNDIDADYIANRKLQQEANAYSKEKILKEHKQGKYYDFE